MELDLLLTETRNPDTLLLDQMTALEIVTAMNKEDFQVPIAVQRVLPQVALAVEYATTALRRGGRLFYLGAGTSGRLGVLDASECPPTFGVSPDCVVGLIAGGDCALRRAVEGAEDDFQAGKRDLQAHALSSNDFVVGIAASGRTPYVLGALNYAHTIGCLTAAIACTAHSEIGKAADLAIEVEAGPEVLTGSTRLKAGTAQKMVLNMISTGAMVRIGKVYQNLMVDLVPSNEKLHTRAENIVTAATGVSRNTAQQALAAADGEVKVAIVMLLTGTDAGDARLRLEQSDGRVRDALGSR